MTDLSDHTALPDTPYEHKVCNATLFCSVCFILAVGYYFIAPKDAPFKEIVMMGAGGIFALGLINFMIAAFGGKLCGCKKK